MERMRAVDEADRSMRAEFPGELAHSAHEIESGKMPACSLTFMHSCKAEQMQCSSCSSQFHYVHLSALAGGCHGSP